MPERPDVRSRGRGLPPELPEADLTEPAIDTSAAEAERREIFASLLAADPFEDEEPEPPEGPPPHVTAVLVCHDGAPWLPTTLAAVRMQTRPPERVVAVDTGSTDASARLLTRAFGASRLVSLPRDTGYGAAIAAALAAQDQQVTDRTGRREWIWLLHDDSAPDPTALERLLDHAARNPSITVLGAKGVDWDRPDRLVDVGLTTDAAGRRETFLEPNELDQGQHDQPRDVLAVGTAGALVGRETWEALDGFDPHLPLLREDIDFGWRARRSGHRVVVVPAARVRHARATLTGQRESSHLHGSVRRTDRAHALYVGVANGGPLRLPRTLAAVLLRALVLLLTRRPAEAWDEVLAGTTLVTHLPRVLAGRRSRRPQRTEGSAAIRPYLSHSSTRLRTFLMATTDRLSGSGELARSGDPEDDAEPDDDLSVVRRLFLRPVVGLVLVLVVIALVADRHVLHGGVLEGGRLLAVPGGASDLWRMYAGAWHDVGGGSASAAAPWLPVLAAVSFVFGGNPALVVTVLVLGAVPLAGLAAWFATGRWRLPTAMRLWAAATYALLPPVTGSVDGGRFDTVVVVIAAPLLVAGAVRVLRGGGGTNHAFALGLGLAVTAAFAPPVWSIALLVLGGGTTLGWLRARLRGEAGDRPTLLRVRDAILVLVTPPVLLIPWTFSVPAHPRVLLVGLGVPGGLAAAPGRAAGAARLLLLSPGGHDAVPLWFVAPLLVAALVATLRTRRTAAAMAVWATIGVSLGIALATVRVSATATGQPPTGWSGTALAVAGAAVLAGALVAARDARRSLQQAAFGVRQPLAVLLAAACAAVPVACAAWLVVHGSGEPLHRQAQSPLPVNIVDNARLDDPGQRVLWLRDDAGAVAYALEPVVGSRIGDEDFRGAPRTSALLDSLVGDLVSDRGTDAAETLATFHIGYVALDANATGSFPAALDQQPALSRYALPGGARLWRVLVPSARAEVATGAVARAALAPAAGTEPLGRGPTLDQLRTAPFQPLAAGRASVAAQLPAGSGSRVLVLSDSVDSHWRATLDGQRLPATRAWGWAQAFVLPPGSGALRVWYDNGTRHLELWIQAVALLVVVVLAAPGVRRPEEEPPGRVADSLRPDEVWDAGDVDDLMDAADDVRAESAP
ncbi:MAG TPA: glycosyltransferase [Mycobacteriales bacterium]